jgi:alkylhydroperoxidase/carboxymuconolactone decarboxylase family protein YurZ
LADLANAYGREAPFWEAVELRRYTPDFPDAGLGDYVHHYEQAGYEGQQLSSQFRELIATLMLVVVGHNRFAARHIRRLYRLGVTGQLVVEVFWAASPFIGRAHVLSGVRAVHLANDASNQEGTLPPAGPPLELADFPELHLGSNRSVTEADLGPDFTVVSEIDPQLAAVILNFYSNVMGSTRSWALPPTARELIAIVCLAYRGLLDLTADHVRIALRGGATVRHVVEALSAAIPMTGLATLQIGLKALSIARAQD